MIKGKCGYTTAFIYTTKIHKYIKGGNKYLPKIKLLSDNTQAKNFANYLTADCIELHNADSNLIVLCVYQTRQELLRS